MPISTTQTSITEESEDQEADQLLTLAPQHERLAISGVVQESSLHGTLAALLRKHGAPAAPLSLRGMLVARLPRAAETIPTADRQETRQHARAEVLVQADMVPAGVLLTSALVHSLRNHSVQLER